MGNNNVSVIRNQAGEPNHHRRVSIVQEHENRSRFSRSPKRKLVEDDSGNVEMVETLPRTGNSWATVAGRNQLNGNYQGTLHNGVRPHNPRRPSALIYGNARTGADDSEQFLAADAELVAYGVSKDATEEQLKQFITSKGINVTAVKKLTTFEEARTYTFRVSIKASDYEKALKPEVWPLRVGVRPFRPKRTNNQTQSWAQQSASSGGFVQTQQPACSGGFYKHSNQVTVLVELEVRLVEIVCKAFLLLLLVHLP